MVKKEELTREQLEQLKEQLLDDIADKDPENFRRVAVCVFYNVPTKKVINPGGSFVCIIRHHKTEPASSPENFICKEWTKLKNPELPRKWLKDNGIKI